MIHKIINAQQIWDSYHIKVTFWNWVQKDFNVEPYIKNSKSFIFWPLKNKETFKLFKVEDDTLVWETWADFCPNVIYEKATFFN